VTHPSAAHTTVTFDASGLQQIIVRKTQNYLNKKFVLEFLGAVCVVKKLSSQFSCL